MRNRLTFPSAGTETKYVWDKHSLNNNGIYKWDRYNIDTTVDYFWDKYTIKQKVYKWFKYNIVNGEIAECVGQVESYNENAYPSNGEQDGYWYMKIQKDPEYNYIYDKFTIKDTHYWTRQKTLKNTAINTYEYGDDNVYFYTNENPYPLKTYDIETEIPNDWLNISSDTRIKIFGFDRNGHYIYGTNQFCYCTYSNYSIKELYENYFLNRNNNDGYINLYTSWVIGFSIGEKTYTWRQNNTQKTAPELKITYENDKYNITFRGATITGIPVADFFNTGLFANYGIGYERTYKYYHNFNISAPIYSSYSPAELPTITVNDDTKYFDRIKKAWEEQFIFPGCRTFDMIESLETAHMYWPVSAPQEIDGEKLDPTAPIEDVYSDISDKYQEGFYNGYYYTYIGMVTVKDRYLGKVYTLTEDYPQNGILDGYWYVINNDLEEVNTYYWDKYMVVRDGPYYKYKEYEIYPYKWFGTTDYKQLYLNYTASNPITFTYLPMNVTLLDGRETNPTWESIRLFRKDMSYVDMNGEEFWNTYNSVKLLTTEFIGVSTLDDSKISTLYFPDKPALYFNTSTACERSNFYPSGAVWYTIADFDSAFSNYTSGDYENYLSANVLGITEISNDNTVPITNAIKVNFETANKKVVYGYRNDYPISGGLVDNYYYWLDTTYEQDEIDFSHYSIITATSQDIYPDGGIYNQHYYEYLEYSLLESVGEFIEGIISNDPLTYPDDGALNDFYYIKRNASTIYVWNKYNEENGTNLGIVYSNQYDKYPSNGAQDGYWYISKPWIDTELFELGDFIEQISDKENIYPINGAYGDYWYVFSHSTTTVIPTDLIDKPTAEMINTYPKDGRAGKYWYVYTGYENNGPYKSKWIQQVETNEENTYPQDGINGYYWYTFNKSYEGYKLQIEDSQIRGGIEYKHNVNPEEDYTIGCVASAEIEFDYDNRNGDVEQYLNEEYCDYYTWQPNDNDWRLVGRFYLDNVNHNRKLVNIKAFDAIGAKCEKFVDEFIANYTFPTTLEDFFGALCAELGVTGSIDTGLVNAGFSFGDNFEAINITGRQLLQYIAEMSCGFIKTKPDDTIILTTYKTKELDLTNSQYTKTSIANYSVDKVEGLTVRTTDDDYGVSAGSKEGNRYIIENNPLFYAQSDNEIQAPVNNIYNQLKGITYTPADIELLQDFGIECGDIITLNGKTFYVMEKELSASGCKLKCFGNKVRAKQESGINSDIVALRGKTNELYRDLEMTKSTLTDTSKGLQSQITQTAEEINLRVTNEVAGLESEISQTAEQIGLRVTNEVSGLESKITQTADSITSTVTDEINEAKSEIKQTTDSISLQVDSQGALVAQLVLDVNGINARGYVTFTDLAGTGTTVINGSNITTGTISADRINMTGAISWGDLDEDCKDTIASYAGADGDDADVPDYIHNTYIDATRIVSPTIQGGTLSAGTTADGYMKLSSTGLNFHSSEKAICGIGYYSGNKELPYIVLGAGVDDYGTDKGMIKKYTNGIWIGDGDGLEGNSPTGTGIFINFNTGAIQKYVNGSASAL